MKMKKREISIINLKDGSEITVNIQGPISGKHKITYDEAVNMLIKDYQSKNRIRSVVIHVSAARSPCYIYASAGDDE